MATLCQHMHVLPRSGGVLDQDSMFVVTLDWVAHAQQVREEMENEAASRRARHGR